MVPKWSAVLVLGGALASFVCGAADPPGISLRLYFYEGRKGLPDAAATLRCEAAAQPSLPLSDVWLKCAPGKAAERTVPAKPESIKNILFRGRFQASPEELGRIADGCRTEVSATGVVADDGYTVSLKLRWSATVPDVPLSQPGKPVLSRYRLQTSLAIVDGEAQVFRLAGGEDGPGRYLAVRVELRDAKTGHPIHQGGNNADECILPAWKLERWRKIRIKTTDGAVAGAPTQIPLQARVLRVSPDAGFELKHSAEDVGRDLALSQPALQKELLAALMRVPEDKRKCLASAGTFCTSGEAASLQWRAKETGKKGERIGRAFMKAQPTAGANGNTGVALEWGLEVDGLGRWQYSGKVNLPSRGCALIPLAVAKGKPADFLLLSTGTIDTFGLALQGPATGE